MTSGSGPKKPDLAPGEMMGGAASLSSKMMRQMIESAPSASDQVDLSALPQVEMPSLEGIEVHVPAQPPVTEDDILQRFQTTYYNVCVDRKIRNLGEAVEMGDEVLVDMIGYLEGRIIPFSAQENFKFVLEPNSFLEGFGNSLAGTPVGETTVITSPRPIQDEFGTTRNLTAAFVVQVKGAAVLSYPDATAPETLAKLGQPDMSLDDIYKAIAQQITAERASAMVVQGMNMALKAVADRIQAVIPSELVQAQIRSMWSKQEGQFLLKKGLNRQDIDASLEGWLSDPDMQQEARQRLKVSMAVLTYAAQEEQEVEPEELEGFVKEFSNSIGVDLEAWQASVADNPEAQASILDTYLYIRTITHLVAQIPIHYGE